VRVEQNGAQIASRNNTSSITFFVEAGEYDVVAEALGKSFTKTVTIPEVKEITFNKFTETNEENSEEENSEEESNEEESDEEESSEEEITEVGLIAHYALDGDLIDSTGNFADATVVGPNLGEATGSEKISYSSGIAGQAVNFDQSFGVRLADNIIQTDNYTISHWIKADQLTNFTSSFFAVHWDNQDDGRLNIMPTDDLGNLVIDFTGVGDNNWYSASRSLNVDTWYHIVLSITGTEAKIYLNNNLIDTVAIPNTIQNDMMQYILGANWFPDTAFDGLIDDLRIYDRAISADKVTELYNMGQ